VIPKHLLGPTVRGAVEPRAGRPGHVAKCPVQATGIPPRFRPLACGPSQCPFPFLPFRLDATPTSASSVVWRTRPTPEADRCTASIETPEARAICRKVSPDARSFSTANLRRHPADERIVVRDELLEVGQLALGCVVDEKSVGRDSPTAPTVTPTVGKCVRGDFVVAIRLARDPCRRIAHSLTESAGVRTRIDAEGGTGSEGHLGNALRKNRGSRRRWPTKSAGCHRGCELSSVPAARHPAPASDTRHRIRPNRCDKATPSHESNVTSSP
jgi:hypothetical protein